MNGILLINKEKGKTSRDMVNELNHIFCIKKIGHTGTLDPLATGILIMCIGKYTKLVDKLSFAKKKYRATIKIGIKTDTLDITGNILEKGEFKVSKEEIINVLNSLKGKFEQEIPIYSAKKINGKKLYEYARNGESVDLPKNTVEIYDINLVNFNNDEIVFDATVSKGTYIRSLIDVICKKLGILGTMSDLVRTMQGNFTIDDTFTIENVKQNNYKLLKARDVLDYKVYNLSEEEYLKVKNGNKMVFDLNENHIILMYQNEEIAIYKKENDIYRAEIMFI